jgi:putative ABC transport system permease protein
VSLLEDLAQDIRYAVRNMRRARGFTIAAVATLAVGIGANTAIYSVLYGVWLAPPKYVESGRLAAIGMQQTGGRSTGGSSYANVSDWKRQAASVESFGMHRYAHNVNVSGQEGAEEVVGHRVSANLFGLLGVRPIAGQALDAEADRAAGPRQALISYSWWQRRYGGDRGAVGRRIRVDDEPFTIAGVMPEGFDFPPMASDAYRPVLWMSLNLTPEQERDRASHSLDVVAKMKPGASIAQARSELATITARLAEAYPAENAGWGVTVGRLNEDRQLQETRPALLLITAAAALVLLIGCVNVANLLLARAAQREHEMAVRRALGVTRARLVRQLLTESAVLAAAGGAAGVLLAYAGLPLLKSLLPANMPRAAEVGINGAVLAFASGASLLAGLLFGLMPAVRQGGGLGSKVRTVTGRNHSGRLLVTVEVALSLVLLAGAALLIESFRRVSNEDLGFLKDHVLTMRLQLAKNRYPDALRVAGFRSELLRRAAALPGVLFAGTVSSLPMGLIMQGRNFEIEGRPETIRDAPFADFANVSTNYLRAMGIAVVSGRDFNASDTAGSQPVALISESLSRAQWPGGGALGSRMRFEQTWFTVAGIVKDVRQYSPERGSRGGTIYALNEQLPLSSQGSYTGRLTVLVIRTAGDPSLVAAAMRREAAGIDKDQPVADVTTMEHLVWRTLAPRRLNTLLLSLFAALALFLAAVGIFGVVAFSVARRTREIGVRIALGASPADILSTVTRETLAFGAAGAVVGLAAMRLFSRVIQQFLYQVKPSDPLVVGGVALLLLTVLAVAGMVPARRATRVDPIVALRQD